MTLGALTAVVGSIAHTAQVSELLDGRSLAEVIAVLNPEPFNGADAHAVAVHVNGQMVGHLARGEAETDIDSITDAIARHGLATVRAQLQVVDGVPSAVIEPEQPLERAEPTGDAG